MNQVVIMNVFKLDQIKGFQLTKSPSIVRMSTLDLEINVVRKEQHIVCKVVEARMDISGAQM